MSREQGKLSPIDAHWAQWKKRHASRGVTEATPQVEKEEPSPPTPRDRSVVSSLSSGWMSEHGWADDEESYEKKPETPESTEG